MKIETKRHDKIIDELDLSGGKGSHFDFWHLHYDFDGKGSEEFEIRKKYLFEAFRIYDKLKIKLEKYPNEFQLWIGIDEIESGDDGVYIHTRNPNSDYFPHVVKNEEIEIENFQLYEFLKESDFEIIHSKNDNTNYFFLYKSEIGKSLC